MKNLYLFIVFFFSIQVHSQLSLKDKKIIADLLTQKINTLRKSKGKQPLERQIDLAKAAQVHSDYMAKYDRLKHKQRGTNLINPLDRVKVYNNSFSNVGENILYTKPVFFPLNNSELQILANNMYKSWRNSRGHYENMISDKFTYGDFGFTYSKKTRRIYATQVFAKKGHIVEGQLSDNAFGILSRTNDCNNHPGFFENLVINIGNAVHLTEDGYVILAHHNRKTIEEIFTNSNDGVAVDLVTKNQLSCETDNLLDMSPIYDGVMLKPIFREELFSKNTAKNPKRFIVDLGKVPQQLVDKDLSINLVFIKSGMKCSYTTSIGIPSRKYDLRPVDSEILNPNIDLKTEGINGIREIQYDFDSGKTTPYNISEIEIKEENMFKIEIKSFTSVDGKKNTNEKLHHGRAQFIKDNLKENYDITKIPIEIEAKENWNLCYYQLELLGLDKTLKKDQIKIKAYINQNKSDNWIDALNDQRKSKAIIYTKGKWTSDDPYFLHYNLTDALLNEDYDLANKVLAEMYLKDNFNLFLNEEFVVDKLFDKKELVQNVSALLLKNIWYYDTDNVVFFVRNWLSKSDELSAPAQKNLLNLYTITARKLLKYWDTSIDDFSKVMHPDKVEPLFENYKKSSSVNPLYLNFHMARIEYFGQTNESSKIRESFDFITNYFKKQSKSIDDEVRLGLFFNNWSMYHLTNEKFLERLSSSKMNEDGIFLLAKTIMGYKSNYDPAIIKMIHSEAIEINKDKWCVWMSDEFQHLRDEGIKELYCESCH